MRVALKGGTLIDGCGGKAAPNTTLVLEDSKIVAIGDSPDLSNVDRVIDAAGKTIMPGIIDTHVHFANFYTGFMAYRPDARYGLVHAKTLWALERMLASGVTAAQDLGGLDAGYVDAEEEGIIKAPRLAGNAVQFLMPTNGSTDFLPGVGGYMTAYGQSSQFPGIPDPHCDGPWECRKKAREMLRAGADVIKIGTGGCLAMRNYDHTRPTFTREEIDAFVDEGRRQKVKVCCHVVGGQGLEDAIKAGVDTIEHGNFLDQKLVDEMAARGTWWVPTFWVIKYHTIADPTQEARDEMKRAYEHTVIGMEMAYRSGVRIAMGSDAGLHDPENNGAFLEMEYMSDAGMSAADVIKSSTSLAAEKIGIDDRTGSLVVGKEADILIVDGDPLQDIRILKNREKVNLVMKAGEAVGGSWLVEGIDRIQPE